MADYQCFQLGNKANTLGVKKTSEAEITRRKLFSQQNNYSALELLSFTIKIYVVHNELLRCRVLHDFSFSKPNDNLPFSLHR